MTRLAASCFAIARIQKPFGRDGQMLVKILEDDAVKVNEPVVLIVEGLPVPFYVASVQPKGPDKVLLTFEDVDTFEAAAEYAGMEVYAVAGKEQEEVPEFEDLSGLPFTDETTGLKGQTGDYYDFPGNPCLALYFDEAPEEEVLLPLLGDFLIIANVEGIVLRTPPGLRSLSR